jgi:hypothetical protein
MAAITVEEKAPIARPAFSGAVEKRFTGSIGVEFALFDARSLDRVDAKGCDLAVSAASPSPLFIRIFPLQRPVSREEYLHTQIASDPELLTLMGEGQLAAVSLQPKRGAEHLAGSQVVDPH